MHLLALHEAEEAAPWAAGTAAAKFGFAFLDAAAGRYYVGAVSDDAGRANLSALLTQVGIVLHPSCMHLAKQWVRNTMLASLCMERAVLRTGCACWWVSTQLACRLTAAGSCLQMTCNCVYNSARPYGAILRRCKLLFQCGRLPQQVRSAGVAAHAAAPASRKPGAAVSDPADTL